MARKIDPRLKFTTASKAGDGDGEGGAHSCEQPGCPAVGEYPAPRSRHELHRYRWFCLEHIKAYNSKWNYFDGLEDKLVEEHVKADTTWRRPTWSLKNFGVLGQKMKSGGNLEWDLLTELGLNELAPDIFAAQRVGAEKLRRSAADAALSLKVRPPSALQAPLSLFGLPYPYTPQQLKERYRILVKKHHPDLAAAPVVVDSKADEVMKRINSAYQQLKKHLQPT